MEALNIDFEVPYHLIIHYYISGSIALILNLLVVYLIIFHSGKLDSFRFYLLTFQITCILSDLNITVFSQPIGLFPICSGYFYGIFSRVFNWSSHVLMTIYTFLMSGQIEVLTICFLRKHKAVMNVRNLSEAPNWKYPIFYTCCILFTCSIAFSIFISNVSREEQLAELERLYPEVAPKFRALPDFIYYVLNGRLIVFFFLTTFGTAKATVIVSILVIRMYKTLNKNASRMSIKTLAKHKTALKSLIMQFMTTPISFFPAFVLLLVTLFPTEYSQKISWWSLMIGTTHSTLCCHHNLCGISKSFVLLEKEYSNLGVNFGFICKAFWSFRGNNWKGTWKLRSNANNYIGRK